MRLSHLVRTVAMAGLLGATALAADTTRVSVSTAGAEGTGGAGLESAVSKKGRRVAFVSGATDLVAGDTNDVRDIFVRDVRKRTTTRVSVSTAGTQSDEDCFVPSISSNGRFVVFHTFSDLLSGADGNGRLDVYLHDVKQGTTVRVSEAAAGGDGNNDTYRGRIAAAGRHVVLESIATDLVAGVAPVNWNIYVRDLRKGVTTHASPGLTGGLPDMDCYRPDLSKKGRHVVYDSAATNIVAGDGNSARDVFWHDTKKGVTRRVSVATGGAEADEDSRAARLSANGRFVVFESDAGNLVSGDTNGQTDVFVHDVKSGATTRVSVASDGTEGTGRAFGPVISANGRYVAFTSWSAELVPGDANGVADVFVHDRKTGSTVLASLDSDEIQANGWSEAPAMSSDGKYVSFWSYANDLVTGDGNNERDVFLRSLTGK